MDLRGELKQKQDDAKALKRQVEDQEEKNKRAMKKLADTRNAFLVISASPFHIPESI